MIQETIAKIQPVDSTLAPAVQNHLDDLIKPRGSLGMLERLAKRFVLATGNPHPSAKKKRICVFAADHGVVDEGLTFTGSEFTPLIVGNMIEGKSGVSIFSQHVGSELEVVDVGINADVSGMKKLLQRKIALGTRNLAREPAMTSDECARAIAVGIERANAAADDGIQLLGTGEMGIGNTTPSSAILAALLPSSVREVTGPGAGLKNDEALEHKIEVIERALLLHQKALQDPFQTLAAVGGLEIAALTGLCLGAAARRLPVVIDGFIASAAALVAFRLSSSVADYLFYSHRSAEPGHDTFARELGVEPILQLGMRLGEGTGAALAMNIIEASLKMYTEMPTFSSFKVENTNHARCFPASSQPCVY
ncbi:nicotinate-nucleotide--dimethylbenzimidazole phosphoribosyltransferase [Puniceicoccus vermicola]|uniref:Nicotinate-nucleotide--dimethylbenzimidazole phosphoribosyltransferase n=1 Tax=Puniceicoccus vermicola TaxID=388746 RepID=A0A7X1E5C2_9BACT|nr:nicotinate-nucleotide--dimethylbenzimidazole phosphoribosyltransferase [Puniceicoccus vermicola]MBC2602883.1 nicotinate-nucleotide--dimethylbenzimidazole phosphoribosyltransferase [Puniceicoccus vermicola]